MASLWDAYKSTITNPLGTFRTGGTAREYWKSVIPYETRYAITGGQGIKRAFAAENERQTAAKYNSPIYGPYGGGQAPQEPTPQQTQGGTPIDPFTGEQLGRVYGSGGGGGGGNSAEAMAKKAALEGARGRYQTRYGEAQKMREIAKQFGEDQYNTLVARAGEKKGELGKAYGRTRGEMEEGVASTKRGLTSAYSSRGLGDSSFSEKARAEADNAFNRNLSYLNEEEASQLKEIDNYLTDLRKQREYNIAEMNYQDFETQADYEDAIASLDSEIAAIDAYQTDLRNSVSAASAGISGLSASVNAQLKMSEDLARIYSSALPSAEKKALMSNIFYNMGRKDPERDTDYYYDFMGGQEAIASNQWTIDEANSEMQKTWGVAPY